MAPASSPLLSLSCPFCGISFILFGSASLSLSLSSSCLSLVPSHSLSLASRTLVSRSTLIAVARVLALSSFHLDFFLSLSRSLVVSVCLSIALSLVLFLVPSLSLSFSLYLSFYVLPLSVSPSLGRTLSLSLSLPLCLSLSFSLSLSLTRSLCLALSVTHCVSLSHTHPHSLSISHPLARFPELSFPCLSLSRGHARARLISLSSLVFSFSRCLVLALFYLHLGGSRAVEETTFIALMEEPTRFLVSCFAAVHITKSANWRKHWLMTKVFGGVMGGETYQLNEDGW